MQLPRLALLPSISRAGMSTEAPLAVGAETGSGMRVVARPGIQGRATAVPDPGCNRLGRKETSCSPRVT